MSMTDKPSPGDAVLNALCEKCGAPVRDHMIGGPGPYHPAAIRPPVAGAEVGAPDAWEWRACIGGKWGAWLYLDRPIDSFRERNGYNLNNGTYELRPLYALSTPVAERGGGGAGGLIDIAAERQRQVRVESWSAAHDDAHTERELARAALCYTYAAVFTPSHFMRQFWPWELKWWKPTDARGNLVKAGALIAAEIDRLDRASARSSTARTPTPETGDGSETIGGGQ